MRHCYELVPPPPPPPPVIALYSPRWCYKLCPSVEETGSLDDLLVEAAEYYEREVDYDLKNMTARIEPIMITIVAVMVFVFGVGHLFTDVGDDERLFRWE